MYDTVPEASSAKAVDVTFASSPTRTVCKSLGAITNSAQTVLRSEIVKMFDASVSASPNAMCFSTTVPSNGARISRRLKSFAEGSAPTARSFCSAFWTAMSAS
ncbi:hypothetical protein G6F59_017590 [Rhizopus arrhizus]|uniref:Uncharacterized protein n=1 Tax=Rhizopus delemar TaxID=936053 RepID=A0A9P6XQJ9_9FUNG|nr:hypothetical protein G6F59_017590 [Rhizopus arrhizus]KAG1530230.1 hypothetical protein G6F50_017459 [Rhizopus delemar]